MNADNPDPFALGGVQDDSELFDLIEECAWAWISRGSLPTRGQRGRTMLVIFEASRDRAGRG